jgi:hypothetical protein
VLRALVATGRDIVTVDRSEFEALTRAAERHVELIRP